MKFENLNFKESQIKKDQLSTVHGGTTTTLITVVGHSENEYEDTNGNGTLDDEDRFLGTFEIPNLP